MPEGMRLHRRILISPSSDIGRADSASVFVVDSVQRANELLETLRASGSEAFGVDVETVGCNPKKQSPVGTARIVCWSIAWFPPGALPHPVAANTRVARCAFLWAEYLDHFRDWLEDPAVPKVGANFPTYDLHCFENHGIRVHGFIHDTKHTSRLWYSSKEVKHDLKSQAAAVLGYSTHGYSDLFSRPVALKGKVYKRTGYSRPRKGPLAGVPTLTCEGPVSTFSARKRVLIPLDEVRVGGSYESLLGTLYSYAAADAKYSLELAPYRSAQLASRPAKSQSTLELYNGTWNPMLLMLSRMEHKGMGLDVAACAEGVAKASADMQRYLPTLHEFACSSEFNPGSPDQVRALLRDQLRLPEPPIQGSMKAIKPSKPGEYPTSEVSIYWLELHCPEYREQLGVLRKWRKARKLAQYMRDLPRFVGRDGRVHTVMGPDTDSGRLSAKLPALQQIPAKDIYGVRKAFVAAPGHVLVVSDMSQLEVYVLAHVLLRQFNDGSVYEALQSGDVYGQIAKLCWPDKTANIGARDFKHHADPAVRKMRDLAKVLVLATNYCMSPQGLALALLDGDGEPAEEAFCSALLETYMHSMPGVAKYQRWAADYATQNGGIPTLLGRWRPLPGARSEKRWEAARAHRQAANGPIQGSAMDVMVRSMLGLNTYDGVPGWYNPELAQLGTECVMQLHDELIFESPEDNAAESRRLVEYGMENPPQLDLAVRLRAETVVCSNWAGAK